MVRYLESRKRAHSYCSRQCGCQAERAAGIGSVRSPSEGNDRQNPPPEAVGKFLFLEWPFQAAADMRGFNFSLQSDVDIGRLSAGNVAAISMIAALRPGQGGKLSQCIDLPEG